jgi:hypothetical protein
MFSVGWKTLGSENMLLIFLGKKNYSRLCVSHALNHPLLQVHPPTENSKLQRENNGQGDNGVL